MPADFPYDPNFDAPQATPLQRAENQLAYLWDSLVGDTHEAAQQYALLHDPRSNGVELDAGTAENPPPAPDPFSGLKTVLVDATILVAALAGLYAASVILPLLVSAKELRS